MSETNSTIHLYFPSFSRKQFFLSENFFLPSSPAATKQNESLIVFQFSYDVNDDKKYTHNCDCDEDWVEHNRKKLFVVYKCVGRAFELLIIQDCFLVVIDVFHSHFFVCKDKGKKTQ